MAKDLLKLMNNAVFVKTMENLCTRPIVEFINNQSNTRKLTSKPSFYAFKTFNEDLVAVHMLKQRFHLNRPINVGFTILDVSKTLMYDFHYYYIKKRHGHSAQLLFTNTDILCYNISTENTSEYDQ
jgi:hypothetical protein